MKLFVITCVFIIMLYACTKTQTSVAYDTHLFQLLQAHSWVFDSALVIDSASHDTTIYASDTADQVTTFNSQLYTINDVRDTIVLDTTTYQAVYDNPDKIYYYTVGEQVANNQYLTIDTVSDQSLILNKMDTLRNVSVNYYHAK